MQLFRVTVSSHWTEYVATNDVTQPSMEAAQEESGSVGRLKLHRELKQLTGVEACQCRKARIQRNPSLCAARLDTVEDDGLPAGANDLSNQAWPVVQLLDDATQATGDLNASCVSPVAG